MNPKAKKIVSWLTSAILTWLLKKVLDKTGIFESITEYFTKPEVKEKTIGFLSRQFFLWEGILFIGFIIIFLLLARLAFRIFFGKETRQKKENTRLEAHKKALKKTFIKDNSRIIDNGALEVRYSVEFDIDDTIYIGDLKLYCRKHGATPMLLINDRLLDSLNCSFPGCNTSIHNQKWDANTPISRLQAMILSEFEQNWREEMNKIQS